MRRTRSFLLVLRSLLLVLPLIAIMPRDAAADDGRSEIFASTGKVWIYGLRMVPENSQARRFSDDSWGAGLGLVAPIPSVSNLLALNGGFEFVDMLSEKVTFVDPDTRLRTEQHTDQTLFRIFAGGRAGAHGHGFLRPYVGLDLALVIYTMSSTLVIPDDSDPDNSIRQDIDGETRLRFGYDAAVGVDLNPANSFTLDVGVRYVKSFGVPQQLGEGSVTVHPDYLQMVIGLGVSFDFMSSHPLDDDPVDGG